MAKWTQLSWHFCSVPGRVPTSFSISARVLIVMPKRSTGCIWQGRKKKKSKLGVFWFVFIMFHVSKCSITRDLEPPSANTGVILLLSPPQERGSGRRVRGNSSNALLLRRDSWHSPRRRGAQADLQPSPCVGWLGPEHTLWHPLGTHPATPYRSRMATDAGGSRIGCGKPRPDWPYGGNGV